MHAQPGIDDRGQIFDGSHFTRAAQVVHRDRYLPGRAFPVRVRIVRVLNATGERGVQHRGVYPSHRVGVQHALDDPHTGHDHVQVSLVREVIGIDQGMAERVRVGQPHATLAPR